MTTQTQTTAQTLAADLQSAEQAVADLQAQRAGILAKIVAGELPPSALDDHDAQIATAMADAQRRREIAQAASAEADRQRAADKRTSGLAINASLWDAYDQTKAGVKSSHDALMAAMASAEQALNDLRTAQEARGQALNEAQHQVDELKRVYGDDPAIISRAAGNQPVIGSAWQLMLVANGVYAGGGQKLRAKDIPA